MSTIRKDGKAYDSGDVIITLLGAMANEVGEISYNSSQEHQRNYYLGSNRAKTWSMGKVEQEASMSIAMGEASQIEKLAPGGDIMKIKPFDIVVSFVNDFNEIVNDILTVKFQNQGREVNGDMGLMFKYELFVLDIKYNQ